MLTLVLLAQLTTYPTAAPASRPVELRAAEPVRAKTLSEIAAGRKGSLVLPTVVPAAKSPTPQPLPTIEAAPVSAPFELPAPRPTFAWEAATPAPPKETARFPVLAVAGLVALAVVAVLVFVRRSATGSRPVTRKPAPAGRPLPSSPVTSPAPRIAQPSVGSEFEWRWGGNVGPAEELEVVGARFQHCFLRRWGSQQDGELEVVGDSSFRAVVDRLAGRVLGSDALSGSFDAWLKPEPGHTHDSRIVAVIAVVRPDFIEPVGYLAKADAAQWQPLLLELERKVGRGFLAHGRVVRARREGEAPAVLIQGRVGLVEEALAARPALLS